MPRKGLQLLPFVAVLMFASASFAQEQWRGMLGNSFDLKGAILSPAPIGPPSPLEPPPTAATPQQAAPMAAKSEAVAPRKTVSSKPRQKTAVAPRKTTTVAARKPKPGLLSSYARD